jgi:hypothetical protein
VTGGSGRVGNLILQRFKSNPFCQHVVISFPNSEVRQIHILICGYGIMPLVDKMVTKAHGWAVILKLGDKKQLSFQQESCRELRPS